MVVNPWSQKSENFKVNKFFQKPHIEYISAEKHENRVIFCLNRAAHRVLGRFCRFYHRVVNHFINFVSPTDSRVHTQLIENKNGQWKEWVRKKHGIRSRVLHLHLLEFQWRDRFGKRGDVLYNLWSQIVALYPCNP